MMKRFIYLTVVLMLILMSLGCAGAELTPVGTQKTQDLSSTVGNSHFVGDTSPDARGVAYYQMHGR